MLPARVEVVLVLILAGCASTSDEPEVEDVLAFADVLLARTGVSDDFERAGFLTRDKDGSLGLVAWTFEHTYRRAVWRGPIPPSAFAVIHTHPAHLKHPSHADVEEAARIRMPFIVVTRQSVCVAACDRRVTCSSLNLIHRHDALFSHLAGSRSGTMSVEQVHERPAAMGAQR
jgi:hypothetical protein